MLSWQKYELDLAAAKKASLDHDVLAVRKRRTQVALVDDRLRALGCQRQSTPPDGNCQFYAVCRMLGFPDDAHWQLRQEVVDFLRAHGDDFSDFQADGWTRYLDNLASGEWGDHLTLTAMSRMFTCSFKIVEDNADGTIHDISVEGAEVEFFGVRRFTC